MTGRLGMTLKGIFLICLIIIAMFGISGCGSRETADPGVPETTVPEIPDVPEVTEQSGTVPDTDDPGVEVIPEIEYDRDYPRTEIGFTYNDLFEGTLNPEGTIRLMIIPFEIEGGDPIDDEFLARLKQRIEGPYDGRFCQDVRQYYLNASYGKVDLVCDIMPTYQLGITLEEWTGGERLRKFKYMYTWEAIGETVRRYVPDPGIYDSDSDGYLDGVITVINEPIEVEWVSGAPRLDDYESGMMPANARVRMFVDTMVHCFGEPYDFRCNTVAHELAHCFGIEDYYDYRMMNAFSGYFDLQSASTFGDWNSYSKLSVGWIEPYVITPDVEKVTLKLRNSAEYPDAILIPCGEWNGTPFDEYLLLDVFADRGNNRLPFDSFYTVDTEYESSGDLGGVRLLHVDARLMRRVPTTGEGLGWFNDFSGAERYSKYDVCQAYSNSSTEAEDMNDSPDRNPDYHLLTLITAHREKVVMDGMLSSYLFHSGDVFTVEKYSRFFPNYPLSNKYSPINYRFTVESFDNETKEAIITIEREH